MVKLLQNRSDTAPAPSANDCRTDAKSLYWVIYRQRWIWLRYGHKSCKTVFEEGRAIVMTLEKNRGVCKMSMNNYINIDEVIF